MTISNKKCGIRELFLVQIQHYFDFFAGTGTDGILALAVASGKTFRDFQYLYFLLKEHVR